jgi:hypothetical protein
MYNENGKEPHAMKKNLVTKFLKEEKKLDPQAIKAFVIKQADGSFVELSGDFDLKRMQKEVGGYIELVHYVEDENFELLVDEEGLLKNKGMNFVGYLMTGYWFAGDLLFLRKGILK